MVSNGAIPWYNVPARRFPALIWLEQRYPFVVSPVVFARRTDALASGRRWFPALVWLEARPPLRLPAHVCAASRL